MAKGKRRQTIPCLESMEDRMVPSAVSFSPSVTAEFRRLGHQIQNGGNSVQNYLNSLVKNRPGHGPIGAWPTTHHVPIHQSNTGLFGIPWLKL